MKYEYAVYTDENGEQQKLKPSELSNLSIADRVKIRELELYDETEEYRVYPRFNKKSPHFYCPSEERNYDKNNKDKSEKHDERVKEIVCSLQELEKFKVGYYNFENGVDENGKKTSEKFFETLVSLEKYTWSSEVSRILNSKLRVQHDVFGTNIELGMSQRKPFMAIEVVKSHFPEKNTYEGLIELSKQIPLLVAFDFTKKKNYFFQIDQRLKRVRVSIYIYNGSLWSGCSEFSDSSYEYALEHCKGKDLFDV
ncbi:hypothetical protein [Alteromonas stellipolaris]|uniref:hypothetical protein n=1 Tax=Alteromonas stellipolaris TaxID=233316 RepID=UPI0027341F77|nr:hypothetical protein [Alteromonas stellipolaris]MDP2596402.1 hypothetical protein [Alteromonas stellipolaris]